MMKLTRRGLAVLAAAAFALPAAQASDPANITIVVPYPPGGLADTLARLTGKVLAQNMGTTVIVENKAGANGILGLQAVAGAKPDGSVIGIVPASVVTVNPNLYKSLKIDTAKDITPLTLAITVPNVLVVNPSVPAKTMPELVAYLKNNGGKVSYGSMGTGSSAHLNGELLARSAQLQITHVPYKGSAAAMQDLMAGNIQMAFENLPTALPLIQSGKLRALGVTSTNSSAQAPDVPPIGKSVPGFEDNIWFGFIAPAGLPPAVEKRLHEELVKAIRSDEVTRLVTERGATTTTSTPAQMRQTIITDREKWGALVKERNISVE